MEESEKCEKSGKRIDKLEKYIRIAAKYFDIGTSQREQELISRARRMAPAGGVTASDKVR